MKDEFKSGLINLDSVDTLGQTILCLEVEAVLWEKYLVQYSMLGASLASTP